MAPLQMRDGRQFDLIQSFNLEAHRKATQRQRGTGALQLHQTCPPLFYGDSYPEILEGNLGAVVASDHG